MVGKFIICALASLFVCGALLVVIPAVGGHAFFISTFSVRWIMLIGVGCLWLCHRVVH